MNDSEKLDYIIAFLQAANPGVTPNYVAPSGPFAGSGTADFDDEASAAALAKWERLKKDGASEAEILAAEVDYLRKHAEAQKKRS